MMYRSTSIALVAALGASSVLARSQITFGGLGDQIGSAIESAAAGPWGTVRKQVTSQIKGWASEGVRKFDNVMHDGHDCKLRGAEEGGDLSGVA